MHAGSISGIVAKLLALNTLIINVPSWWKPIENQPQSPSQRPQICLIEIYTYHASFTLGLLAYDIIVDSLARVCSGPDGFISTARSGKSCTTKVLSLPCLDSSDWRCGEIYCLCFPRLKHSIWPDGEKTCCTANLYYNFATENASKDYIGRPSIDV